MSFLIRIIWSSRIILLLTVNQLPENVFWCSRSFFGRFETRTLASSSFVCYWAFLIIILEGVNIVKKSRNILFSFFIQWKDLKIIMIIIIVVIRQYNACNNLFKPHNFFLTYEIASVHLNTTVMLQKMHVQLTFNLKGSNVKYIPCAMNNYTITNFKHSFKILCLIKVSQHGNVLFSLLAIMI